MNDSGQTPASGAATVGQGAAQGAPPKSNKKWWFIGCGCALVLCFFVTVAAALIGYVVYTSSGSDGKSAAARVVTDQAEAIKRHDFETAYDFMSNDYRAEIDVHAFEKTVEANAGWLLRYTSLKITRDEMGQDSATVVVDVGTQDGQKATITYLLRPDDSGTWKIEGFDRKVED